MFIIKHIQVKDASTQAQVSPKTVENRVLQRVGQGGFRIARGPLSLTTPNLYPFPSLAPSVAPIVDDPSQDIHLKDTTIKSLGIFNLDRSTIDVFLLAAQR